MTKRNSKKSKTIDLEGKFSPAAAQIVYGEHLKQLQEKGYDLYVAREAYLKAFDQVNNPILGIKT